MADRLLAEFATDDDLATAIRALRERGYHDVEAYTPYPSHEVEDALARRPSRLPIAVFVGGMAGALGAYLLQWLLVAKLYPLVVGARPPHFPVAFMIITFEMGVLAAGLTAVLATLYLGRLVRLVDDVQGTAGFESVTRDGFWVEVTVLDHSEDAVARMLADLGASRVTSPEVVP